MTVQKTQQSVLKLFAISFMHLFRPSHIGFKMLHTAQTYNITVNHWRRILSTTSGHSARWNDKTLILFDLICGLHSGELLQDVWFELYDYANNVRTAWQQGVLVVAGAKQHEDAEQEVRKVKYQGAWVLVDNGNLSWSATVPPIKTACSCAEKRFSAWLESLRKDVECTFGILKGRWRVLKTGICLSGVQAADNIFLTCCSLHNWLLFIDGLDDQWQEGVSSEWEGQAGEVSLDNLRSFDDDAELLAAYDATTQPAGQHQRDTRRATTTNLLVQRIPDAIMRLRNPVARREFEEATADYIPTFGLSTNNRTASILQVIEGHKDLIIIAVPRKFVNSPCMHSEQSLSCILILRSDGMKLFGQSEREELHRQK